MNNLKKFLIDNEQNIINDLEELISYKSIMDKTNPGHPFGEEVSNAFKFMTKISNRDNLKFKQFDNYALEISLGSGSKDIGILHHIDVVGIEEPDKWMTEPFKLFIKERNLFGRGVNDNKGPLIFSYYLLKYLSTNENFLNELEKNDSKIKLIIGGAEETTWEGIDYYKKNSKEPKYSFSPDGNYPLVFLEKGILRININKSLKNSNISINSQEQFLYICNNIEIIDFNNKKEIFSSSLIKSRNPNRLEENSALYQSFQYINKVGNEEIVNELKMIKKLFFDKYDCSTLGFNSNKENGDNTVAITAINLNKNNLNVSLDFRHDQVLNKEVIINKIRYLGYDVSIQDYSDAHYVDRDSFLVNSLHSSYVEITNSNEKPIYFSGKSYARAFKNSVAFGVSFNGEIADSHKPNEKQNLDSLILSTEIINKSIWKLVIEREN